MKKVVIGDCTLICGDCLDVLPTLEAGSVDAVVTDPPYGVEFTGKVTKEYNRSGQKTYQDDSDILRKVVLPAIFLCIEKFSRCAVFVAKKNLMSFPQPKDIGAIYEPNGAGCGPWGFSGLHPILFYGKNPYLAKGLGSRPTCLNSCHPGLHVTKEVSDHPCPKPIAYMRWLVNLASLPTETVLDCFMGSGTTGVACLRTERKFIGIEKDPGYFDIAVKRIEKEYQEQQHTLFQTA